MDWFVCFMSGHPRIQARCQEEIDKIGKCFLCIVKCLLFLHTEVIFLQFFVQVAVKLRWRVYVEACLYETMRLGSAVALGVPHCTLCDSQVGKPSSRWDTQVGTPNSKIASRKAKLRQNQILSVKSEANLRNTQVGSQSQKHSSWKPISDTLKSEANLRNTQVGSQAQKHSVL